MPFIEGTQFFSCAVLVCRGATGLRVDWTEEDQKLGNVISVPSEIYANGCVRDVDDGLAVSIDCVFLS